MVSSRNNGFWKQVGKAARVAVGLQPGDVAPTTAQMMRLLSKYFPASPLPPSPPLLCSLSLSLSICESAYPSTPLSLSFFSLISFILTTTNFQLGKHTHTHCHLFRNNVE